MSTPRLPQLGSVIWAELADANGILEVRPVVVVTATADIECSPLLPDLEFYAALGARALTRPARRAHPCG